MKLSHKFARAKFTLIFVALLALSFACKVEPTATKSYTVTIDANGGAPGSLTSKSIDDGNTFPKPSDSELPTKADSEIAYWSTVKDDYSGHFEFDKTPVTSDITIYPHYRDSLAKINSILTGDWLVTQPDSTIAKYLFRVNYQNKQLFCQAKQSITSGIIDLSTNNNLVKIMKVLPSDGTNGSNSTVTVDGIDYTATIINDNWGKYSQVSTSSNEKLQCYWNNKGTDNSLKIKGYAAENSNEVILSNFVNDSLIAYDAANTITLKSYSDTKIIFDALNSDGTIGTYTGTRN